MTRLQRLRKRADLALVPSQPFNFKGTVWKPSHFPAPTETFDDDTLRFTMRFRNRIYGVRLLPQPTREGGEAVRAAIYASNPLSKDILCSLSDELRWRFDLDADLTEFLRMARRDPLLRSPVERWAGMRVQCKQNISELLAISVVLQNATVRRSVQMLDALLRRYGKLVQFDRRQLYTFWGATRLAREQEDTLRAIKLGYRAKTLVRLADSFREPSFAERRLRRLPVAELREKLLGLYGVGPASVGILLFELFHHYDALDQISPWEQQIYSHLLFDEPLVSVEHILRRIDKWRPWRMLAMHYLFEDLFWTHQAAPVPWLTKLIRL